MFGAIANKEEKKKSKQIPSKSAIYSEKRGIFLFTPRQTKIRFIVETK